MPAPLALGAVGTLVKWGGQYAVPALATAELFDIFEWILGDNLPGSSSSSELDPNIKLLLEDVVKTNRALLQLRNVNTSLYEPLNIDTM